MNDHSNKQRRRSSKTVNHGFRATMPTLHRSTRHGNTGSDREQAQQAQEEAQFGSTYLELAGLIDLEKFSSPTNDAVKTWPLPDSEPLRRTRSGTSLRESDPYWSPFQLTSELSQLPTKHSFNPPILKRTFLEDERLAAALVPELEGFKDLRTGPINDNERVKRFPKVGTVSRLVR
jgi:hypothetical protein